MARAQSGDQDAYRRLLNEILPLLRALVARHHRNPSDGEEVVQETLLSVHVVRRTYDPTRPFLPWLLTLARRRVVDWLRQRGRAAAREVPLTPEHETFACHPVNRDDGDWSPRALQDAIAQLPEAERRAITMLKLGEMSLIEAAAASGTSISALKVATHRATRRLRAICKALAGNE